VHRQRVRLTLAAALLAAAVAAFYASTAGVGNPDTGDLEYYDGLTTAVLHGRLDLRPAPPPGLLALRDPYDPAASEPFRTFGRFHDLALYHGRFYATWGPAPLLLFVPLRLVGVHLSHAVAAFLLGLAAWLFGCGALVFAVRRWLPETPAWLVLAGALVLAAGDMAPFAMERPRVYEVAALSGACCSLMAACFLLRGTFGEHRRRVRDLAVGSTGLGLALLSRPHLAVGAVALAGAAVHGWRRWPRARGRTLLAALAPFALLLGLFGAYDAARFGSPLQTGVKYQLTGPHNGNAHLGELPNLVPGAYFLLLAPPEPGAALRGGSLVVPRTYPGSPPPFARGFPPQRIAGLLPLAPILALAAAVPWLLGRLRRRRALRELRWALGGLWAWGALVPVALAYLLYPPWQRYEVDFAGLLVLAALLTWLALAGVLGRRARLALHGAALAAGGWTTAVGIVMGLPITRGH
jgi:hypothetical protein